MVRLHPLPPKTQTDLYGLFLFLLFAVWQETLKKAKDMGINPVLCFNHDDNVPAWKTSEKLGGKLDSVNTINGVKIRKYIIDTSKLSKS